MPDPLYDALIMLPAYNEAVSIGYTLTELTHYAPAARKVVIDNNSIDGTAGLARELGAIVFYVPEQGKGNAVRYSLARILDLPWSWLVMMDSDFTYPAKHVREVVERLVQGADVVMGYRRTKAPGSMPAINGLGNKCLSVLASGLYGLWVRDVCTGLWGFRREALEQFKLTSTGFTLEAEMLVEARRTKCRIAQIPIEYRARLDGDRPKLKVRDGFKIGLFLIDGRGLAR
ncbi:MAG: glycosyltransferase family 2 protein [Dehalococcoidia bacterium]|nr:glycosyltransferase family 2 protein [Dehalococcoidia bacterium]